MTSNNGGKAALKESDYLQAFVVFYVAATIGGIVAGAAAGFVLGAVLGAMGATLETIKLSCGAAGLVAGVVLSYWLFRLIISRFIVEKVVADATPLPNADSN